MRPETKLSSRPDVEESLKAALRVLGQEIRPKSTVELPHLQRHRASYGEILAHGSRDPGQQRVRSVVQLSQRQSPIRLVVVASHERVDVARDGRAAIEILVSLDERALVGVRDAIRDGSARLLRTAEATGSFERLSARGEVRRHAVMLC